MGLFSFLTGKKEKAAPPEPLVLGARLRCPYADTSYLYVESKNIDINRLPQASVDDSVALYNIQPFGRCERLKASCSEWMEIEGIWENPEPQKVQVNGREIITMKSQLACKHAGMDFIIETSGQDGLFAESLILIWEMEEKYPGLLAILQDPYGSLYGSEGMYLKGIQFLEDRMKAHGGEINLLILEDKTSLDGELLRAVIAHLLPDCATGEVNNIVNSMRTRALIFEMDGEDGWNENVLNEQMLKIIKEDCERISKGLEIEGLSKSTEGHKLYVSVLAETIDAINTAAIIHKSMNRNQKKTVEAKVREGLTEKKTVAKGESGALEGQGKPTTANPYNLTPNQSTNMGRNKFNKLVQDIKANGIKETIKYVEYDGKMYVVDGHHRLKAAKTLGLESVPIEEVQLPYQGYKTIEDLITWGD